ncbi:MAG TPA: metallophosphoesterase [Myxococcota bacterium]
MLLRAAGFVVVVAALGAGLGACSAGRAPTPQLHENGVRGPSDDDDVPGAAGHPGPLGDVAGSADENGGTFSALYFAVVGDTRPPGFDDTAHYPTAAIEQIYQEIAALKPAPQFVVSTGDFMFASNGSGEADKQMSLYMKAAKQWQGPLFAAMGNHECATITSTNCTSPSKNMAAFEAALVKPLHKDKPWYVLHFRAVDDPGLTVKIIVTACNAWDREQRAFFDKSIEEASTYTVVVRHEPHGELMAPCIPDQDAAIDRHPIDLLLAGHIHTFAHDHSEVIVGNGGAPPTSSQPYGFATVELVPGRGFRVMQYDAALDAPIDGFLVRQALFTTAITAR